MSDDHHYCAPVEPASDTTLANGCWAPAEAGQADAAFGFSIADLHRRCIALEDERRSLAVEIDEGRASGTAECRRLIEREGAVIREIGNMLDRMQTAPVRPIDDIAALVDLALDIEFDAPSPDFILKDRPWTLRLLRALRSLAPDVEMSWLRRQSPRAFDPEAEIFTPSPKKD